MCKAGVDESGYALLPGEEG